MQDADLQPFRNPDDFLALLRWLRSQQDFPSNKALAELVDTTPQSVGQWLQPQHPKTPTAQSIERSLRQLAKHPDLIERYRSQYDLDSDDSLEPETSEDDSPQPGQSAQAAAHAAVLHLVRVTPGSATRNEWITERDHLHPSLKFLFSSSVSPADLRHRAWGAVIAAMAPWVVEGHEPVLFGVRPDGEPVAFGYRALTLAPQEPRAERYRRGSIVKLLEALEERQQSQGALPQDGASFPWARLSLLFLAGLAEPGFLLALAYPDDNSSTVPLLGESASAGATSVGSLLYDRIVEPVRLRYPAPRDPWDDSTVRRALSFLGFTAAKILYDGLLDADVQAQLQRRGPPADEDDALESLFVRVWRSLELQAPEHLKVIDRCVPILAPGGDAPRLWEQYSHLWFGGAPVPLEAARFSTGGPRAERVRRASEPPSELPTQLQVLRAHLDGWETTGIAGRDRFFDSQVRVVRCELPTIGGPWKAQSLSGLARDFASSVSDTQERSHLVVLSGPYGTGKTTIAQRLFDELDRRVRGEAPSAAQFRGDGWQALAWDASRQLLVPRPLYGSDATLHFKQQDLSRVLMELGPKVVLHLAADAIRPGSRLILNAAEMNAIALGEQSGRHGLEAIEALVRELTEKHLPRSLVCFVALQSSSLVADLGRFFGERPDLVMGRARLDTVWLVRGDCVQLELLSPRGADRESLVTLLEDRLPGCPTLTQIIARRISQSQRYRARHLRGLAGPAPAGGAAHPTPWAGRFAEAVPSDTNSSRTEPPNRQPIDEYVPKQGDRSLDLAFQHGVGTLVSTQVALWNGFQRQFWDLVRNEARLLLHGLAPGETRGHGSRPSHETVENLARCMWLESLESVAFAGIGFSQKERDSFGNRGLFANASVACRPFPSPTNDEHITARAPGAAKSSDKVRIQPWYVSEPNSSDFDTGWVVVATVRGPTPQPHEWAIGVDVVRRQPKDGLTHHLRKANTTRAIDVDTSADGKARLRWVGAPEDPPVSSPRSSRLLPVTALPAFLAGVLLRLIGVPATDESTAGPSAATQSSDDIRLAAAADVWIDDRNSPDPSDWVVVRLLVSVRPHHQERLNGSALEALHPSVQALFERVYRPERPRGIVVDAREVARLLWRCDRWLASDGSDLSRSTPLDAYGMAHASLVADRGPGTPVPIDELGRTPAFTVAKGLELKVARVEVDNVRSSSRICVQRIYQRYQHSGDHASPPCFAVAVVQWMQIGQGQRRFRPSPGLELQGDELVTRTSGHSVRLACLERHLWAEHATLLLVGAQEGSATADEDRIVRAAMVEAGVEEVVEIMAFGPYPTAK